MTPAPSRAPEEPMDDNSPSSSSLAQSHINSFTPPQPLAQLPNEEEQSQDSELHRELFTDEAQREQGATPHDALVLTAFSPVSSLMSNQKGQLMGSFGDRPVAHLLGSGCTAELNSLRHTSDINYVTSPSYSSESTTGLGSIQESCLLRYFIEELSPWVRLTYATA